MKQTVALTGATGFVGGVVLRRLLDQGHQVCALARQPDQLPAHPNLHVVAGRLEDGPGLEHLVRGVDTVVHLAAAIAGRSYQDFARVNAAGTSRLVTAAERHNLGGKFLLISSLAARSPGLSHYARSKKAAEHVVQSSSLDWMILRPPAVYGPTDPALAPLWRALARGWLPRIGPRDARFSLLHVDDLAEAIRQALVLPRLGRKQACVHDGRPGGYTWNDLTEIAGTALNRRVRCLALPRAGLMLAARINLLLSRLARYQPLLSPGKVRELTHSDWVCGDNLNAAVPDWQPRHTLQSALPDLPGWRQDSSD